MLGLCHTKRAKYNFVLIPPFFTRDNPDVTSYINCFYILLQNKGRVNELLFDKTPNKLSFT